MKSSRFFAAILLAGAIWFGACKSGTTSPNETADLLPLGEGNYWVYARYELDSNEQRVGSPSYDSVIVGAAIQLAGRQAYPLYTIAEDNSRDTTYVSKDADGNIWQYMDFSVGQGNIDLPADLPTIPPRWVKMTSVGAETSWTILDTTFSLQIPGIPLPLVMNVKVTNAKAGTESVSIGGKTYTAQKFTMTYTGRVAGVAEFTGSTTASYVAGIGRAKDHSFTTISSTLVPDLNSKSGSEAVLVRYLVK